MIKMKYCFGPMSKNIVDFIINYSNQIKTPIGIIPSRRQIEYLGGYVNHWNTTTFTNYLINRNYIYLGRDHSGPNQGIFEDDGLISLQVDSESKGFNCIHIDPWKKYKGLDDGIDKTVELIKFCHKYNKNMSYEIGTEESIRKFHPQEIKYMLKQLKDKLGDLYSLILFVVVQGGTSLSGDNNTGVFNFYAMKEMVNIVKNEFGKLTKEHNGDYQSLDIIKTKFEIGLDSINIAPELGTIESSVIIENLTEDELETFFYIVFMNKTWKKWFPENFNPFRNKKLLIKTCGHYVYSHPIIEKLIEEKNINLLIQKALINKFDELYNLTK